MRITKSLVFLGVLVVLTVFGMSLIPSTAQAGDTVDVGVTRAMEAIINAFDTAAVENRLPEAHGEIALRWTNLVGADTTYRAPAAFISDTVDTGWDMSDILAPDKQSVSSGSASFFGETETVVAGDSVIRALQVENLGNNYVEIDFTAAYNEISAIGGPFSASLYYADGRHTEADFDSVTMAEVAGADGDVEGWTMGEVKTLFIVVEFDPESSDGDQLESGFTITNNAPIVAPSATGDAWQRGVPVAEDDYDNQTGVFWTAVEGPDLVIDKTHVASTLDQTRPGDTIGYQIVIENEGSGAAENVIVIDAIPQFTTFLPGSATGDDPQTDLTIDYENSLLGEDFTDLDDDETVKIRWTYGELPGGESRTLNFAVTID